MRQIIVEQGNEFKINIREIQSAEAQNGFEKDIFGAAYKQAGLRMEEIVTATDSLSTINTCDEKSNGNYLNNIIAFSGERGQGKSSAMLSFTHYLENLSKIEGCDVFQKCTKSYKFISLETIDPSTFEDMHNILEVVIARMYNNFSGEYKKNNTCITKDKKNKIMELFQKVYGSLCLIRNQKKLEELEYDYEGSIQQIAQIGDSTNLQKTIKDLVKIYLEIMTEGKSFLVIPIDDLDINIKYAYKITEQIRKYLIVPNVVIIMAINIEQLKKCVEMEFRKQFSTLINKQHPLPDDEPITMAAKYVEKLIPDGRKISLPEIRVISQSGNDAVELIYHKRESKVNILDNKNRNGIEETLLGYIYDKTEIVFVKPQNGVHDLIPNTLREVVNLLSVFGKMEDLKGKDIENKKKVQLENILLFEDYFLHTWIPNNLDYGNSMIIKELLSVSDFEKHRLLCVKIMDTIEKTEMYTVDSEADINQLGTTMAAFRDKFSIKNTNYMSYSLGDVFDMLYALSTRYINTQTINLVFTFKTVYTIIMHKIVLNESDKNESSSNSIYKFVGGNLWGIRVRNTMRQDRAGSNRASFLLKTDKFLGVTFPKNGYYYHKNKLDKNEAKKLLIMAFWSNFPMVDPSIVEKLEKASNETEMLEYGKAVYNQVIYENNYIADNFLARKNAEFSISNFLISFLDIDYLKIKSGLKLIQYNCDEYITKIRESVNIELVQKIVINMELCEYILQYSAQKARIKRRAGTQKYFENFIKRIENSLGENRYIELGETKARPNGKLYCEIFKDVAWENALKEGFVTILNSKITKDDVEIESDDEENENQNEGNQGTDLGNSNTNEGQPDTNPTDSKPEDDKLKKDEYYEEINELLNREETEPGLEKQLKMNVVKLEGIKKQIKLLARIVAHYKNFRKNPLFYGTDIIETILEICRDCMQAEIFAGNPRTKLVHSIKEEYLIVANKVKSMIENLPPEEK